MNDQLLPPPTPGQEPVSTDAPQAITQGAENIHAGKTDQEIGEQIGRIADKLIKRAEDALAEGPLEQKLDTSDPWMVKRAEEVEQSEGVVTHMKGKYGADGYTRVKGDGEKTKLLDVGPQPEYVGLRSSTTINAEPDKLVGHNQDTSKHTLNRDEIISASAKVLGDTRGAIVRLNQARKEEK